MNIFRAAYILIRTYYWWLKQSPRWYELKDGVHCHDGNEYEVATFELRQKIAPILKVLTPGYSGCERCNWPWSFAEPHTTDVKEGLGCFCLCVSCWEKLSHSSLRLPYYRRSFDRYWSDRDWSDYEAAVRREDDSPFISLTMIGIK